VHDQHWRIPIENVVTSGVCLWIAVEDLGSLDARVTTTGIEEPERRNGTVGVTGDADLVGVHQTAEGAIVLGGGLED
jgi:hypothetical protein